jgi:hypothetical protein
MPFDLSSQTAQLAFDVARRAQETQDYKDKLAEEARARVQAQLAPFGNDNPQTMATFNSIYEPAAATRQARAKAMQEYVTGLPELLARVQAEKRAGLGGGGVGVSANPNLPFDVQAVFDWITANYGKPQTDVADTQTPAIDAMRNRGTHGPVATGFQRVGSADRWEY